MNKIMTTILSAGLLSASFSVHAYDLTIDDAYLFEDDGIYEVALKGGTQRSISHEVSLDDMYRFEEDDAYSHGLRQPDSDTPPATRSVAKQSPGVPSYANL